MNTFDSRTVALRGCNLIEASAGTGKTYAIASLYIRLIVEKGLLPDNILVVTFTEAATKELRDRIRSRLREARDVFSGPPGDDAFLEGIRCSGPNRHWPGDDEACARLDAALQMFDCAAISTIHGFCSRMLLDNAFESGSLYDTELVAEQAPLIRSLIEDFWRRHFFSGKADLLPLVEANVWNPEEMAVFLKSLLRGAEIVVLPQFDQDRIEACETACHEAYTALCAIWRKEGEQIRTLLLEHGGLSRAAGAYRSDALADLFVGMDGFVAGATPYALFQGVEKLTPEFMARNALKKTAPPEHELFTLCSRLLERVRERRIALRWQLYDFVKEQLPLIKSSRNVKFYEDLLIDLDRSLSGPRGEMLAGRIRGRFAAALIDEFQDTDQIQYRIFDRIFTGDDAAMFLIGDPKQAIYSFRGADIYAYLKAKSDVPDERHFTMDKNWRSVSLLVDAVNHLFSWKDDSRPLVIPSLEFPAVRGVWSDTPLELEGRDASPLQMWLFKLGEQDRGVIALERGTERIVAAVGEEIALLLADAAAGKARIGDAPLTPADVAVIVRSHKEAARVYNELLRRGIPAVIRSNQSIFVSREACELRTVLAAVAEPTRDGLVRRALATSLFGLNGNDLAALLEAEGEGEWSHRLADFREYHELWRERGFMVMFRVMLEREGIRGRLLSRPGGERAVTNLLQCGEVLHAEATASRLGMDALCAWFNECIEAPPEGEEHQIRLESDEKAVKILTIHVSKGLEFPVVFCPFSWRGVFAGDQLATCHEGYRRVVDFGSSDFAEHRAAGLEEALAENARLLYVALTRAKYRCYLAWGKFRHAEISALAYLLHRSPAAGNEAVATTLARTVNSLDDVRIIADLKSIAAAKPGCFGLTEDPAGGDTGYQRASESSGTLTCKTMATAVASDWKVSSFSALIGGHKETSELPDHDERDGESDGIADRPAPEGSIFAFPRGARAGTFLHSVLERVDFAAAGHREIRKLVSFSLASSSFGNHWLGAVEGMVANVINAPLGNGLRLSDLRPGSWVAEMEFFFPLRFIGSKQVAEVLRGHGGSADLFQLAGALDFREQQGMLRGFVDLVCCHNGHYCLLDWKSNHLGNTPAAYSRERLSREMSRNLYHWQYLLYTVALNRHLERRAPGYRYEEHFGGAYYLFLRGIDPAYPTHGIYHELPDAALVRHLTACLIDCEGV